MTAMASAETVMTALPCEPAHAGLYCSGWVKTGPVGVILTTMSNAFETAEAIVEDYRQGIYMTLYCVAGNFGKQSSFGKTDLNWYWQNLNLAT